MDFNVPPPRGVTRAVRREIARAAARALARGTFPADPRYPADGTRMERPAPPPIDPAWMTAEAELEHSAQDLWRAQEQYMGVRTTALEEPSSSPPPSPRHPPQEEYATTYLPGPLDETLEVPWPGWHAHHPEETVWRPLFPLSRELREDEHFQVYACQCTTCVIDSVNTSNVSILIPSYMHDTRTTAMVYNGAATFATNTVEAHAGSSQLVSVGESHAILRGSSVSPVRVLWIYYHSQDRRNPTSRHLAFPHALSSALPRASCLVQFLERDP